MQQENVQQKTNPGAEAGEESVRQNMRAGNLKGARDDLFSLIKSGVMPGHVAGVWVEQCTRRSELSLVDEFLNNLQENHRAHHITWSLTAYYANLRGAWEEALEALEHVKECEFWSSENALMRAIALEKTFRPEEAMEELDNYESLANDVRAWRVRIKSMRQQKRYREAIDMFKPLVMEREEQDHSPDDNIADLWLSLGAMHDRLGEYDEAWTCFQSGNATISRYFGVNYSTNNFRRQIETFLSLFTRDWVQSWTPTPRAEKTPVFLVGFPRSGTTLLDQMLDAHPRVDTVEEKPPLGRVERDMEVVLKAKASVKRIVPPNAPWKEMLFRVWEQMKDFTEDEILQFRGKYESYMSEHVDWDGSRVLVDKLPLNIISMGMIKRMYPEAKFIVALRHPCDCVLSAFMQSFSLNSAMANLTDIGQAARFYRQVMRLYARYRDTLDLKDSIMEIRYEDVLDDQEGELTRLLHFLGLDWDPAVARYYEHALNRGTLKTPSYEGVTQRLYKGASGRWQRYRPYLEPVFPELREACSRFGYSLEEPSQE